MKLFSRYFWGAVFRPGKTFRRLNADPHPLRHGLRAVLTAGLFFALTAAALAVTGAVPMAPVFVPFQAENYYFWEMIFTIPLLIFVWVIVSALVYIGGRGGRPGSSFRKTLSLFGLALAWPVFLIGVPQAFIAAFYGLGMSQQEMVEILSEPSQWQTIYFSFFIAAALLLWVLASLAAAVSQNVRWLRALGLGLFAEAVAAAAAFLFLR